jgi:precorrin-6A synthase
MRRVLVIGIGAGDPDYLTAQAARAVGEADVFFVLDKGEALDDLAGLRRDVLARCATRPGHRVVTAADVPRDLGGPSYDAGVGGWHDERAALVARLLAGSLGDGETGAFLVWGDPGLYDSTLRILDEVAARGGVAFTVEAVPGISAPQALAARHGIVLHGVGRPLLVTTGRRLAEDGWPPGVDDVVVMLDGAGAFRALDPDGITIYWGAYLGTPDEILLAGPLAETGPEISRVRAEARDRKGWMFDTYLLRRER